MTIQSYFGQAIRRINKSLTSLSKEDYLGVTPHISPHYQIFSKSFLGGKMLRGMLVCLGYDLGSKKRNKEIYKIAGAMEIVHSSLLIHDDIMDKSLTRRGQPSFYVTMGGGNKGKSLALCFGDLGIIWASQIINKSHFPRKTRGRALEIFCKNIKDTVYGQILDVHLSGKVTRKKADVLLIHRLKTAAYSFVAPMGMGATLGLYDLKHLYLIQSFGEELGVAFQIQDDILGVFGDEEEMGKSATSDISEGKNTLLITYALEHADSKQRKVLKKYYGKKKVSSEELKLIKDIFVETGALAYSKRKATYHKNKAQKLIAKITPKRKMRQLLFDLSELVVKRKK
jgi:geranylgeranyl diphosphate synthase type I